MRTLNYSVSCDLEEADFSLECPSEDSDDSDKEDEMLGLAKAEGDNF